MPWCPKCGAEYVENVRKCKDCGVGLLDHKPTSDEMLPPDPKAKCCLLLLTAAALLPYAPEHLPVCAILHTLLALAAALSLQGLL